MAGFNGYKKGGFKKSGPKKSGNNYDNTKITYLWKTKRPNLFVGTVQDLEETIKLIKKARAAGKGVTFFLWKNDQGEQAAYNLVANVAQDNPNRKEIEDEGDSEEAESEESETDF